MVPFIPSLVLAIKEDRKRCTRRPAIVGRHGVAYPQADGSLKVERVFGGCTSGWDVIRCKFKVDDIIVVRERARVLGYESRVFGPPWVTLRYDVDGATTTVLYPERLAIVPVGHCIPNGVFREGARLRRRVTSVTVERLQDITEEQAKAEGVEPFFTRFPQIGRDQTLTTGERAADAEHRASFAVTWDALYGDREGLLWKANPWVWDIGFEPC